MMLVFTQYALRHVTHGEVPHSGKEAKTSENILLNGEAVLSLTRQNITVKPLTNHYKGSKVSCEGKVIIIWMFCVDF